MLIIRKEQIEVLRKHLLKKFLHRMEKHLEKRYPTQTTAMEREKLCQLIDEGVDGAKGYDITDENDVKRYLEYLVQYGSDFGRSHETTWASQFLTNKKLSGTIKMNEIDDHDMFAITLGKKL